MFLNIKFKTMSIKRTSETDITPSSKRGGRPSRHRVVEIEKERQQMAGILLEDSLVTDVKKLAKELKRKSKEFEDIVLKEASTKGDAGTDERIAFLFEYRSLICKHLLPVSIAIIENGVLDFDLGHEILKCIATAWKNFNSADTIKWVESINLEPDGAGIRLLETDTGNGFVVHSPTGFELWPHFLCAAACSDTVTDDVLENFLKSAEFLEIAIFFPTKAAYERNFSTGLKRLVNLSHIIPPWLQGDANHSENESEQAGSEESGEEDNSNHQSRIRRFTIVAVGSLPSTNVTSEGDEIDIEQGLIISQIMMAVSRYQT